MPVEASVAAIFAPIWPLLPMPVTMTRPRALTISSSAAWNGSRISPSSAASSALKPAGSTRKRADGRAWRSRGGGDARRVTGHRPIRFHFTYHDKAQSARLAPCGDGRDALDKASSSDRAADIGAGIRGTSPYEQRHGGHDLAIDAVKLIVPRRISRCARLFRRDLEPPNLSRGSASTSISCRTMPPSPARQERCAACTSRRRRWRRRSSSASLRGSIFDVAVDIRRASPTFGRHVSAVLTAEGGEQLFVPVGFAHGFCTLEPDTEVAYKVSGFYSREHDAGIAWDDPDHRHRLAARGAEPMLSEKDRQLPRLADAGRHSEPCGAIGRPRRIDAHSRHRRRRIHRQRRRPPPDRATGHSVLNLDKLTYAASPTSLASVEADPALRISPHRHLRQAGGRASAFRDSGPTR